MNQLKEEVILGVAQLLGYKMSLDFSLPATYEWLCSALIEFGEDGWRYHDSKSGSNYYRFKVWLLHIEGRIKVKYLESINVTVAEINDEKQWYHREVNRLMTTVKGFDKLN
jgi:hypothetical protein